MLVRGTAARTDGRRSAEFQCKHTTPHASPRVAVARKSRAEASGAVGLLLPPCPEACSPGEGHALDVAGRLAKRLLPTLHHIFRPLSGNTLIYFYFIVIVHAILFFVGA